MKQNNATSELKAKISKLNDKIYFNMKHFLGVLGTSVLVFAISFSVLNVNRSSVSAQSLKVDKNINYNDKTINVSYDSDKALLNTAQEILAKEVSSVQAFTKREGSDNQYNYGNYIVTFNKVNSEKVQMVVETKDTINKKDVQNVEINANTKDNHVDGAMYTYNLKVKYVDETAPEIILKDKKVTIKEKDHFNIKDYIKCVKDNHDKNVAYNVKGEVDRKNGKNVPGKYEFIITAVDKSGNKSKEVLKVEVKKDKKKKKDKKVEESDNKNDSAKNNSDEKLGEIVKSPKGSKNAKGIVGTARSLIGSGYVYGATGPKVFDCSGFVQYVYKKNGISIPRTSDQQATVGKAVKGGMSNWRAGDIVVFNGHVAIYSGHGTLIHALNPTQGVAETKGTNCGSGPVIAVRRI